MLFQKIYTPGLAINTYLVGDEASKECVVIDPTRVIAPIIMAAESAGLTIIAILETHVHADFVSGSLELKQQLKGRPRIYASGMGGEEWTPSYADHVVKDGDSLKIGSLRLEALHTPGHTPEHVMWTCYDETRNADLAWFVFSGDCLFVGSVGRPDLLGEKEFDNLSSRLYQSLFETLATLPDSAEIFPAHGAGSLCGKALSGISSSTIGYERSSNPYLILSQKEEWKKAIRQDLPAVPPYFSRVKRLNAKGPPLLESLKVESVKNIKDLDADGLFLLDIRHPEAFARFHIEKSVNIPVTSSFCHWAGWMIPENIPLAIITGRENHMSEIINQLRLIGFDQPFYTLTLKEEDEEVLDRPACFSYLTAEDVAQRLKESHENVVILDVRTDAEWRSGHIADAYHVELNDLYQFMHRLPEDRLIAVVCRSGMRASTAASVLKKYGFNHVANIKGGMQAWIEQQLPIIIADKDSDL